MDRSKAQTLPAPAPVDWIVSDGLIDYQDAVAWMEERVAAIHEGSAHEAVWLLEHPPLYTAGSSANSADITATPPFPVFKTGRGGQYTYHGPGQRIAYVMLDVRKRFGDVRAFVGELEGWIIDALSKLGVTGHIRDGRVGVWVPRDGDQRGRDDKIAALGIRLRRWISYHGISINVAPNLSHFDAIVPCGIREHGVTSLQELKAAERMPPTLADCDHALRTAFETRFGVAQDADQPHAGAHATNPAALKTEPG